MKITEPGIYREFPEADYFADPTPLPSLTQSIAKILLDQSPAHARLEHPRLRKDAPEPEGYKAAQAIGNAAHKIMTGRGRDIAVAKFDNFKTKDAQNFREEHEAAGELVVLVEHLDRAHKMVFAAREQLEMCGIPHAFQHGKGDGEVVIAAETDGIWLRSLIDWMESPVALWDLKTTGMSVAPHAVPTLMANAGWPIQAAMQERILDIVDPDNAGRRNFYFVAQENYEPFALTVHEITEGPLTMGRKMLARAEAIWRDCITLDRWPAYPPIVNQPEYPGFKENQWLARELAEERPYKPGAITHVRSAPFDPNLIMAG